MPQTSSREKNRLNLGLADHLNTVSVGWSWVVSCAGDPLRPEEYLLGNIEKKVCWSVNPVRGKKKLEYFVLSVSSRWVHAFSCYRLCKRLLYRLQTLYEYSA